MSDLYPWESMMVPIAEWMGMDASKKSFVFPNLANFDASHVNGASEWIAPCGGCSRRRGLSIQRHR